MLKGHIDGIEHQITGWAMNDADPSTPLCLDVYVGGAFYASVRTGEVRPDLDVLGTGRTDYGFRIAAPPGMRADEVVFATVDGEYIVPIPAARQSHLLTRVNHLAVVEPVRSRLDMIYSGPSQPAAPGFLSRICDALLAADAAGAFDYGPLWGQLASARHGELVRMARARAIEDLGAYLSELGRTALAYGFFDGPDAHEAAVANPYCRTAAATVIFDRVLSLAESLGCLAVENPEQGPWGDVARADPDALLGQIAATLGIDPAPPVGGFWGLPTRFGVLNARVIDAIHAASRIVAAQQLHGLSGVTEIGGGAGLVAYYSLQMQVAPYMIVDLPTVGAVQAYALRHEGRLALHAEQRCTPEAELLPPWEFGRRARPGYDLLFNMDSLPEIETGAAIGYLKDARRYGYRFLLSINQESGNRLDVWTQGKVHALAEQAGGYTRISRHRDWMRPGYAEELYRIDP